MRPGGYLRLSVQSNSRYLSLTLPRRRSTASTAASSSIRATTKSSDAALAAEVLGEPVEQRRHDQDRALVAPRARFAAHSRRWLPRAAGRGLPASNTRSGGEERHADARRNARARRKRSACIRGADRRAASARGGCRASARCRAAGRARCRRANRRAAPIRRRGRSKKRLHVARARGEPQLGGVAQHAGVEHVDPERHLRRHLRALDVEALQGGEARGKLFALGRARERRVVARAHRAASKCARLAALERLCNLLVHAAHYNTAGGAKLQNFGSFDYVIVGAGSAGCLLANRFARIPQHRVLLLEAGGQDDWFWIDIPVGYLYTIANPRTDWCYKTEPDEHLAGRSIHYARGRVLGGCSSINAMIYMRGQKEDWDHWASLGNRGWSWDEVLPIFQIPRGLRARRDRHLRRRRRSAHRGSARALGHHRRLARSRRRVRHPAGEGVQPRRQLRLRLLPDEPEARPALERDQRLPAAGDAPGEFDGDDRG